MHARISVSDNVAKTHFMAKPGLKLMEHLFMIVFNYHFENIKKTAVTKAKYGSILKLTNSTILNVLR